MAVLTQLLVVAVHLLAADQATSGAPQTCDCARVAEHNVSCYVSVWKNHADAQPRTVDDLEALLDTLREGDRKDLQELELSGCSADDRIEACVEQCMQPVWESHYRLIREAKEPVVRWGAITLAFEAYMDIGAPEEVRARLEGVARDLLGNPRDTITTAAVLRMIDLYEFGSPEVVGLLLRHMTSPDPLVRQLSFDRFAQYTGTKLRFDAEGEAEKRAKQVKALRRWWNDRQSAEQHGGRSRR